MEFLWTTIEVKDLEDSVTFYQQIVGLSVSHRIEGGPSSIVFMGDGETKVELISHRGQPARAIGEGISIGFRVANLEEKIAFLSEQGIAIYEGPVAPTPTVRFFYILDPNGVKIQFVESL
jgi:lactoylglutathione lyase